MRVTGSITIVCRGIIYPNLAAGLGILPSSRSLSTEKIRSAEGGQPGTNTSTGTNSWTGRTMAFSARDEFVDRAHDGIQRWNHLARNLRVQRGVLQVGAFEDGVGAEVIAHGRNVAGDGAIAQRHEDFGARAHQAYAV